MRPTAIVNSEGVIVTADHEGTGTPYYVTVKLRAGDRVVSMVPVFAAIRRALESRRSAEGKP